MSNANNRGSARIPVHLTTYVRKELPAGGYSLMVAEQLAQAEKSRDSQVKEKLNN